MRSWMNLFETDAYFDSEENIAHYAGAYMRGMGASNAPEAQLHQDAFDWRHEPAYPIANLNPEVDKGAWMRAEIKMWREEEGQPNRYDDEIEGPIRDPIIVIEIDGVGQIIDGWHRTGASEIAGRKTIPAVVGVLKTP